MSSPTEKRKKVDPYPPDILYERERTEQEKVVTPEVYTRVIKRARLREPILVESPPETEGAAERRRLAGELGVYDEPTITEEPPSPIWDISAREKGYETALEIEPSKEIGAKLAEEALQGPYGAGRVEKATAEDIERFGRTLEKWDEPFRKIGEPIEAARTRLKWATWEKGPEGRAEISRLEKEGLISKEAAERAMRLRTDPVGRIVAGAGLTVASFTKGVYEGITTPFRPKLIVEGLRTTRELIISPEARKRVVQAAVTDPLTVIPEIAGGIFGGYVFGKGVQRLRGTRPQITDIEAVKITRAGDYLDIEFKTRTRRPPGKLGKAKGLIVEELAEEMGDTLLVISDEIKTPLSAAKWKTGTYKIRTPAALELGSEIIEEGLKKGRVRVQAAKVQLIDMSETASIIPDELTRIDMEDFAKIRKRGELTKEYAFDRWRIEPEKYGKKGFQWKTGVDEFKEIGIEGPWKVGDDFTLTTRLEGRFKVVGQLRRQIDIDEAPLIKIPGEPTPFYRHFETLRGDLSRKAQRKGIELIKRFTDTEPGIPLLEGPEISVTAAARSTAPSIRTAWATGLGTGIGSLYGVAPTTGRRGPLSKTLDALRGRISERHDPHMGIEPDTKLGTLLETGLAQHQKKEFKSIRDITKITQKQIIPGVTPKPIEIVKEIQKTTSFPGFTPYPPRQVTRLRRRQIQAPAIRQEVRLKEAPKYVPQIWDIKPKRVKPKIIDDLLIRPGAARTERGIRIKQKVRYFGVKDPFKYLLGGRR